MDKLLNKDIDKIIKAHKRVYWLSPLSISVSMYCWYKVALSFIRLYLYYDLVGFGTVFFPYLSLALFIIFLVRFISDSSRYRLLKLSTGKRVWKRKGYTINKQVLLSNAEATGLSIYDFERVMSRKPTVSELQLHSIKDKDLRFTTSFLTKVVSDDNFKKIVLFSNRARAFDSKAIEIQYIRVYGEVRVLSVVEIPTQEPFK